MNVKLLMNQEYWSSLFANPVQGLVHLVDILLVIALIYYLIRAIAGTKIMTLIRGVFLFLVVQVVATLLGLQTISWLMNQVITYGVIAAVVIFAPELRAILEKLGRTTTQIFGVATLSSEEQLIHSLVQAVDYLAPRKIGALIAIEQAQTLQEYVSTGIPLQASISSQLLINIFIPNTPLHDGAVIIQEDKISVSCAYLPLTERGGISKEFGTRHRAAIGLTEVSDALVLIVSEETGNISIAKNGTLLHDVTLKEMESILRDALREDAPKETWWKRLGGKKDGN